MAGQGGGFGTEPSRGHLGHVASRTCRAEIRSSHWSYGAGSIQFQFRRRMEYSRLPPRRVSLDFFQELTAAVLATPFCTARGPKIPTVSNSGGNQPGDPGLE